MKKLKIIAGSAAILALLATTFAFRAEAETPRFDVSGTYVVNMELDGALHSHDMTIAQDSSGNLTGSGGYPAGSAHAYAWTITSGKVSGNYIEFDANYTAGADALTPLTTLHVEGTVNTDGTITGTWADNYQGGLRTGDFITKTGTAVTLKKITASAGSNGSISPSGTVLVKNGDDKTFTITANSGYDVKAVIVDGVSVGAVGTYTFNDVVANHTISASFVAETNTEDDTFTIKALSGANGTISPSGNFTIKEGDDKTFTFTANTGYELKAVFVDGVKVQTSGNTYTFTDVDSNHVIFAVFRSIDDNNNNDKKDCKKDGWRNFRTFRNQGDCVKFFHHHKHDDDRKDRDGRKEFNAEAKVFFGINKDRGDRDDD